MTANARRRTLADWPFISIIVPIRNEEDFIGRTLEYILTQDYPSDRLEVIVVDGESDDNTVKVVERIAEADERVKMFSNPKRLSSSARNIGAKSARGEIVTFIDGHVFIDNDQLLKSIALMMTENKTAVLSRPQFLDTPDSDLFQRAVAVARKSFLGHGLDSTIYTDRDALVDPTSSGASYRRELFDTIGYFDERFDACEDLEFNYRVGRAGYRAFTSLKLAVYYYPRKTVGALFEQMKRYGVGRMRMALKHPGSLSPGTLIPALFTAGLVVLPLLSLIWKPLIFLFLALYGLYGVVVLLTSLSQALKNGPSFWPRFLVIYPTIHIGLGWGFLVELGRTLVGQGLKKAEVG